MVGNSKGLQDNIDYAFDVLSEITGRATIHRGIYEDVRDSLRAYTIISDLEDNVIQRFLLSIIGNTLLVGQGHNLTSCQAFWGGKD